MNILAAIERKRDGEANTPEELKAISEAAATGSAPDYQLAAWLMAAYLKGLSAEETAALTMAMAHSGEVLNLSTLPKPWVDKHSTGGVGDKTTIVLLPLLAACGLTMVKMSGRGLGITGGTVDKLASIPGFRLDLSPAEMVAQAGRIGLALAGQTADLAPADKALYALRDVTATVDSVPLIVASILSKKIAGGAETIVLDVKCGSGALMTSMTRARELAKWLVATGKHCGLHIRLAITDMDQPLGRMAGNALEVLEAIEVLQGTPGRFRELCLDLAAETLEAAGIAKSEAKGREIAAKALGDGSAAKKASEWFLAQGAEFDPVAEPGLLVKAPVVQTLGYQGDPGWVGRVDARAVGEAVVQLGGGRKTKEDAINLSVGVETLIEVGQRVEPGQAVFRIHAQSAPDAARAVVMLEGAVAVSESAVSARPRVLEAM